ncbi:tRNA uridine(34) 5-carboxymethylaminomethyl modification radical SAM/GNAT enzyme Elp3 [Candidatus Woesearchaeota archaeon]|nr:tRNA uridine(34) 5-carboxymethylaminomethyl modification radical SAM/GNAT enzyme Elp3 [Candidatus Woesearchaeota archaeon]
MKTFYSEIIEILKKKPITKTELNKLKNKLSKKHRLKKIPTNIEILMHCNKKEYQSLKRKLITKPTRTGSGVAVIAIMTEPKPCPHAKKGIGPCIMCPGGPDSHFGDIPQSYTGHEPATMRAKRNNYDAYLQIFNRLEQYIVLGQTPEKVELIIMGGTFPSYKKEYKENFIKYSFKALNDFSDFFYKNQELDLIRFKEFFELPGDIKNKKRTARVKKKILAQKKDSRLEKEQKKNENSKIRCIGLTIETRPDYAKLKHANQLLEYGCTRVELGIQTTDNKVLKKIKRGHSVKESIDSTRTLKDLGFKINYHMMPGLPGSTQKKDLEILKEIIKNPDFRPDMLKIYPAMVLEGTELYEKYKKEKFKPMTTKQATKLISKFKKHVPEYIRIMRVQRDIPTKTIAAGVDRTNLRQYIKKETEKNNIQCRCIRCREPKNRKVNPKNIKIYTKKYKASKGKEYFISAEDKQNNIILGFLRIRFPDRQLRPEITKDTAIVRELHVYGRAVSIGKKGKVQHKGYGKKLLAKAEQIAKKNKKNKIIIISGIGARNYYRKLGYKKQGPYMVKNRL